MDSFMRLFMMPVPRSVLQRVISPQHTMTALVNGNRTEFPEFFAPTVIPQQRSSWIGEPSVELRRFAFPRELAADSWFRTANVRPRKAVESPVCELMLSIR